MWLEPRKVERQTQARITATVLELEREPPKIRASALRRWREAGRDESAPSAAQGTQSEVATFWDWAILELLLLSGLRVEEAYS